MTIEVRQLVIRSSVGEEPQPEGEAQAALSADDVERLRRDILAECKAWMADTLREQRER